ncbi:MAG TPA: PEGA domain-containing protein, partial [Polyangia bacterium]|nr:PEGA domain-containing protein [Polyangia bacterium]
AGVQPGEHVVRLKYAGRSDVERHVQVKPGERTLVDISMPTSSHRVSVSTAPDAATVFLDGKLVLGTTPTFMTVADDDFHEVRIERAGYEPIVHSIKPEDTLTELSFTLEPETEPRGTITVESSSVAQVFVDGIYTGYDTPTLGIRLAAGGHTVELRDSSGARSAPARINLQKGEYMHLTLSLAAKP